MQIQVNLPIELNKKLKLYKVKEDLNTLEEALIDILKQFFKDKDGK